VDQYRYFQSHQIRLVQPEENGSFIFRIASLLPKKIMIKNAEVIAPFVLFRFGSGFEFSERFLIQIAQSQASPSVSISGPPEFEITSLKFLTK